MCWFWCRIPRHDNEELLLVQAWIPGNGGISPKVVHDIVVYDQITGIKNRNIGARYTRARIQINADCKWTCQVQIYLDLRKILYTA